MNSEDTVTVTQDEYEKLVEARDKLNALQNYGVDNWEGYDEAMSTIREEDEEVYE